MTLTPYANPMSRGRFTHWRMEEMGQPHDRVHLDFGTTMQAPDYLALDPMGKVPTPVHDGRISARPAHVRAAAADDAAIAAAEGGNHG